MRFFLFACFACFACSACSTFFRIFYDLAINDQMTCHETHKHITFTVARYCCDKNQKVVKICGRHTQHAARTQFGWQCHQFYTFTANAFRFLQHRIEAGHHFSLPSSDHIKTTTNNAQSERPCVRYDRLFVFSDSGSTLEMKRFFLGVNASSYRHEE